MAVGTVKWFNRKKGYGFIAPDIGTKDVFVHMSAVQQTGYNELYAGERLEFELAQLRDGRVIASAIKKLDHLSI